METPLLARGDTSAPSLSSGPVITEEEETNFSRLIALSNPLAALAQGFDYELAADSPSSWYRSFADVNGYNCAGYGYRKGPIYTVLAGAFCLLHLGFIWGAYMSDVWSETHLQVSIAWQKQYLPFLDDLTDTVVHRENLATILEYLNDGKQYGFLIALWSTSLILPCAFMILSPTFIASDYNRIVNWDRRIRAINARRAIEIGMRFALLAVFTFALLDLSTSVLELQWTDTVIRTHNRALGPLGAYALGVVSAIGVAVVLRWPPRKSQRTPLSRSDQGTPRFHSSTPAPLPPGALERPWQLVDPDEPNMMALEEVTEPPLASQLPRRGSTSISTPELVDERPAMYEQLFRKKLTFGRQVLLFQLGVLLTILWLPSTYLPVVRITYSGALVDFLKSSHLQVYLWDIPIMLSKEGLHSGTAYWIVGVIGMILLGTVVVIPLLATCLCTLIWVAEGGWSTHSRTWLFCIQPALGGLVFSVALFMTSHALFPIGSVLFRMDGHGARICDHVKESWDVPCLAVKGTLLPGAWSYLLHSVILEVFVLLTLRWS
jgi:hypothetical protein